MENHNSTQSSTAAWEDLQTKQQHYFLEIVGEASVLLVGEKTDFLFNQIKTKQKSVAKNADVSQHSATTFLASGISDCEMLLLLNTLEFAEDPDIVLEKATKVLSSTGKLVASVFLGFNIFQSQEQTYYISAFYNLLDKYFAIKKLEIIDGYIYITAQSKEKDRASLALTSDLLLQQEIQLQEQSQNAMLFLYEQKNKEKRLQQEILLSLNQQQQGLMLLEEMKLEYQHVLNRNSFLLHENREYQRKLSRITDTWYGKLALKAYRFLKRIKGKIFG